MPHIALPEFVPGIVGLFQFRPETAPALVALAETLLRGPSALTRGERELIASFVSARTDCSFCAASHGAFARAQLPQPSLVELVRKDWRNEAVPPKLKALLTIAEHVRVDGRNVTDLDIAAARRAGCTDVEIHDC